MKTLVKAAIVMGFVAAAGAGIPSLPAQTVRQVAAEPQVKDDLFDGVEKFAKGANDVTDINLSPDMMTMLGGTSMSALAQKTKFIVVHNYSYPQSGMYKAEDIEPFRRKIQSGDWKCIIHDVEQNTGETTDICLRPAPDHNGNEFALISAEPKELTFIHMSGSVSLSDLQTLSSLASPPKVESDPAPAPKPSPAPSPAPQK